MHTHLLIATAVAAALLAATSSTRAKFALHGIACICAAEHAGARKMVQKGHSRTTTNAI
jgi:hypothetical protein